MDLEISEKVDEIGSVYEYDQEHVEDEQDHEHEHDHECKHENEEDHGHEEQEQFDIKIPKRIFQTHKSIEYIQSVPKLQNALNSWRRYVPEFGYHFFTDEMCDEFMKTEMVEEFGDIIYEAYNKLHLAVMKADLWRYCVIYKYGGIYADTDAICMCNPNMFTLYDTMLVCAPENDVHLCQWCFAGPANSPMLRSIIELSLERIIKIEEIKGEHVIHYLTGPGVFTDGIERYLKSINNPTYKNKQKYYLYKNPTMICFMGERFHQMMIHHLFTGQDQDGWSNERYQKLM
uniref:Glycosyltransferase n=1 Tax=viral metagenome TaxID=1070528 RepID=A0A6C0D854_9ZZZZ